MTRPDPEEYVEVQPVDDEAAAVLRRVEQILGPDYKAQFALKKTRTKNTKGNGES